MIGNFQDVLSKISNCKILSGSDRSHFVCNLGRLDSVGGDSLFAAVPVTNPIIRFGSGDVGDALHLAQ